MRALVLFLLTFSLCARADDKIALLRPELYTGLADASGAVAISSNLFVVADDENNALRL